MPGTPQTIELNDSSPVVRENLSAAGSAIKPGYLVELNASLEAQAHGTAATNAVKRFALTNIANGGDIDQTYAVGETVRHGIFKSGDEVYALLAAAAAAVTNEAALESAGDGTLRVQTAAAATAQSARDSVVAYAIEDVDNSGGGAEARIRVRVA